MWTTARDMFHKGGVRPFFVGAAATVSRDFIFGGAFAVLRHYIHTHHRMRDNDIEEEKEKQKQKGKHKQQDKKKDGVYVVYVRQFLVSMVSASVATVLSSPFNYIRNMHYACPPDVDIISELYYTVSA